MLWTPSSVNHRIGPWRDGRSGLHAKQSAVLGVKSCLWREGERCWRNIPSREQGTYNNYYPSSACEHSSVVDADVSKTEQIKKRWGLVGQDCNSSYSRGLDRSIKSSTISWAVESHVLKNLLQIWLHEQDQANQHPITEVGGIHGPTAIAGELLAADGFWGEGKRERQILSRAWSLVDQGCPRAGPHTLERIRAQIKSKSAPPKKKKRKNVLKLGGEKLEREGLYTKIPEK